MQPVSAAIGPQSTPGRTGPFLFLSGFSMIGLGVLLESWVTYYYLTPPFARGSVSQLQNTLFEWAIVNSTLIGTGALLAAIGWIVWDRQRTKKAGLQVPPRSFGSLIGFVLAGLGATMIAGAEYFNALTTYAALQGNPWTLPGWIGSGAFTFAMIGGGLVLTGAAWFARSAS